MVVKTSRGPSVSLLFTGRSKVVCREFGKVVCFIFVNCLLYDSISNKSLKCLYVLLSCPPKKDVDRFTQFWAEFVDGNLRNHPIMKSHRW